MKKIIYILLLGFFGIDNLKIMAQFTMDFRDTSTFRKSCGEVNPDHWSVKDDSCMVFTPILVAIGKDTVDITFVIKLNQSGNLTNGDVMFLYHSINSGEIIMDDTIYGGGLSKVNTITKIFKLKKNDRIQFNFVGNTTKNSKFWQIKSGDMNVSNVTTDFQLPINLSSFYVLENNGATTLSWITLTETNNDYFTIEKSNNGINYKPIASIDGAGNSNMPMYYNYTDLADEDGLAYYRLRQTDFDGKYTITTPITVYTYRAVQVSFQVYPNPITDGSITISIYSPSETTIKFNLIDHAGRSFSYQEYQLNEGVNHLYVNIEGELETGIYLASIIDGRENMYSQKMIVK